MRFCQSCGRERQKGDAKTCRRCKAIIALNAPPKKTEALHRRLPGSYGSKQ